MRFLLIGLLVITSLKMNATGNLSSMQATYIYNFLRLVSWPETGDGENFIIGVMGDDETFQQLVNLTANRKIGTKKLIVKKILTVEEAAPCQLVFVSTNKSNKIVELKNLPDVIISFSACLINLKKKLLTFSNAGHFPLLVLRNNQIIEIKLEGAAFGLKKNNKYNENHFQINNQDKIILYSDGLKELKMNDNITFEKILLKNINASDYSIKVIEEIKLQSQEKKYLDDVTFISIDIK